MKRIVLLFSLLFFSACLMAQNKVIIYGKVSNYTHPFVPVNKFDYATQQMNVITNAPVKKDFTYATEFELASPTRLSLFFMDAWVTPGDSIEYNFSFLKGDNEFNPETDFDIQVSGRNAGNYQAAALINKQMKNAPIVLPSADLSAYKKIVDAYMLYKQRITNSILRLVPVSEGFLVQLKDDLAFERFNLLSGEPIYKYHKLGLGDYPKNYFEPSTVSFVEKKSGLQTTQSTMALSNYLILFQAKLQKPLYTFTNFKEVTTIIQQKHETEVRDYLLSSFSNAFARNNNYVLNDSLQRAITSIAKEIKTEKFLEVFRKFNIASLTISEEVLQTKLLSAGGDIISLTSLLNQKDSLVYLDFWASWCKPCIEEVPYLEKERVYLKQHKIKYIAISIDKEVDKWKTLVRKLNLKEDEQFLVLSADADKLVEAFGAEGIPKYSFVAAPNQILIYNAPRPSAGIALHELVEKMNYKKAKESNLKTGPMPPPPLPLSPPTLKKQ